MNPINKIIDLIMFRETSTEEELSTEPRITEGSIIWGAIFRSALVIFLSFFFYYTWWFRQYWWMSLFVLWLFAIYPAYRQYQRFKITIDNLKESTLCGSCKHFDATGQICIKYDEHVTEDYIPCEGADWEPYSKY